MATKRSSWSGKRMRQLSQSRPTNRSLRVEFDATLELNHQARHTALGHSHTNFANGPFAGDLADAGDCREINPDAVAIAAIAVFEKRVEIEVGEVRSSSSPLAVMAQAARRLKARAGSTGMS